MNTTIETFERRYSRYLAAQAEANRRNRARVCEALAASEVTAVIATFDGYGDNGQIESIKAYAGDTETALPRAPVVLDCVVWGTSEIVADEPAPLKQAIETLCHGYLTQLHDGWATNHGASGEFKLSVAGRSIALAFRAHGDAGVLTQRCML